MSEERCYCQYQCQCDVSNTACTITAYVSCPSRDINYNRAAIFAALIIPSDLQISCDFHEFHHFLTQSALPPCISISITLGAWDPDTSIRSFKLGHSSLDNRTRQRCI